MSRLQRLRWLALGAVFALLAAACGGGDDATDTTGAAATTTAATGTTVADVYHCPWRGSAATRTSSLRSSRSCPRARSVTRRWATRHSFGAGSGFILSPDGLAVTNNHVVAGAATLEVFVGGDTSTSYNATILGVSECNDLALIDIAESEPLPYLEWFDGE